MKFLNLKEWNSRLDKYRKKYSVLYNSSLITDVRYVMLLAALGTNLQKSRNELYIKGLQHEVKEKCEKIKSKC